MGEARFLIVQSTIETDVGIALPNAFTVRAGLSAHRRAPRLGFWRTDLPESFRRMGSEVLASPGGRFGQPAAQGSGFAARRACSRSW